MKGYVISLSDANAEYIDLICRLSGESEGAVIDAAIDIRRAQDAEVMQEVKALMARISLFAKTEPGPIFTDQPKITLTSNDVPEVKKPRKKPGRKPKNFVEDTIREVKQNEKMSKDEFVDYFSKGAADL